MTTRKELGALVCASAALMFVLFSVAFLTVFLSPGTYAGVPEELTQTDKDLRSFLLAGGSLEFLEQNERDHMRDVRYLFTAGIILFSVSLALLILLIPGRLERCLWYGGWGVLVVCALLGVSSLNFERFWTAFHLVLFPQGNWMFPADSVLIQMYPGVFFHAFVQQVVLRWVLLGALAVGISVLLSKLELHERAFKSRKVKRE